MAAPSPNRPMRVLIVYGTRPEAIKLAPVARALRRRPASFDVTLCSTAQHREMLDVVHEALEIRPDISLDLMTADQGLNALLARALSTLGPVLSRAEPDMLLVQGDTTTALAAALAAFNLRIAVGHVEAGLRTYDLDCPFPEEGNRQMTDKLSRLLFAPTESAARALLAEGASPARIHVTGNTVVDALLGIAEAQGPVAVRDEVLVTVHRRESFGAPLVAIFQAIRELSTAFPATHFFYPVHRNPNVLGPARLHLADLPNVELADPLGYGDLVRRLRACRFVLTDSGGLQEEAPTFGKPVLVLREKTERTEGIAAGVARLVGTSTARIVQEGARLLGDRAAYEAMAQVTHPYGDGHASERIATILEGWARTRPRNAPPRG